MGFTQSIEAWIKQKAHPSNRERILDSNGKCSLSLTLQILDSLSLHNHVSQFLKTSLSYVYNCSFSGETWLRQVSCVWGWFCFSPEQTVGTHSPVEESPAANPSAVAMSILQLLSMPPSAVGFLLSTPLYWGVMLSVSLQSLCSVTRWPNCSSSHTPCPSMCPSLLRLPFPLTDGFSQPCREGRDQNAPDNLFQRGPLLQFFQHQLLRLVVGEGAQNWLGDTSLQDLHGEWG